MMESEKVGVAVYLGTVSVALDHLRLVRIIAAWAEDHTAMQTLSPALHEKLRAHVIAHGGTPDAAVAGRNPVVYSSESEREQTRKNRSLPLLDFRVVGNLLRTSITKHPS